MKSANSHSNSAGGFTLVEIMIAIVVLGIIVAVTVPSFVRARNDSRRKACIANLHEIDSAVQQWALENKKTSKSTYALTNAKLKTFLKGSVVPACPAGGTYSAGSTISHPPTCSQSSQGHSL